MQWIWMSKICFKRAMSPDKQDTEFSDSECADSEISDADLEIFQKAYEIINLSGRGEEFLAALTGLRWIPFGINSQEFVMSRCDLFYKMMCSVTTCLPSQTVYYYTVYRND